MQTCKVQGQTNICFNVYLEVKGKPLLTRPARSEMADVYPLTNAA